jgi:putative ABC transport system ATP-binding protein
MAKGSVSSRSYFEPLFRFCSSESQTLWIILIHAVGVGFLSLTLPVAVQSLVNTVAFGTVLQPVVVLTLIVFICLSASTAFKLLQTLASEMLQRRIFVRFSLLIASRLPNLGLQTRRAHNVQETVNRFFDIFLVQKALAFLLLEGVALVLQTTLGLVLLAFYHPFLLVFGLLLFGSLAFICLVVGRGAIQTAVDESSAKYAMAAWLEEMTRVPLSLSSKAGNNQALQRADAMASLWLDARETHFKKIFAQTFGTLVLQVVSSCVLLGFGGWLVIRKELSLGQLVAAELIVTGVLYSIAKMGKQFESFYDVVAGLNKLENILDIPVENRQGRELQNGDQAWKIELKNVSVSDLESQRQLKSVQLVISPGTKVLIRGASGSGKSLLAGLLFGALQPDAGEVLVQGQDLRYIAGKEISSRGRLVQDLELIEGTIEENLLLGVEGASLLEINQAMDAVGLTQPVAALNAGLKTRMSSRGNPLTLSQSRRLMLARAILSKPRLLILDKNSDWLQSPSQGVPPEQLLQRLFKALGSCSVVVFAEPDFTAQPVISVFDALYDLAEGGLRRA